MLRSRLRRRPALSGLVEDKGEIGSGVRGEEEKEASALERKAPSLDLDFFFVGSEAGATGIIGRIPGGAGGGCCFIVGTINFLLRVSHHTLKRDQVHEY